MTDEIRRALEARIPATAGSPARQERVRARIAELESKEEPIVKRKLSVAVILVAALMLLGSTALAAGLGLNLFELLGGEDPRLKSIADKAVLETQVPVTVADDKLGEMEAVITNAYYDGESLSVAYAMTNWKRMEPWTPTDEEIALLEPYSDSKWMEHLMHTGGIEPAANGAPFGAVQYQIYASDHMTANGIDMPSHDARGGETEDILYEIHEYLSSLPEGVRNQDKLELRIPLHQNVIYFWFDGSQWFMRSEGQKGVSTMTATVYRDAEVQTKRYTGSGEVNGVPVTVTVDATINSAEVNIVAAEDVFFPISLENGTMVQPWLIDLSDEQGRFLYEEGSGFPENDHERHFHCMGTGSLPESLTLRLYSWNCNEIRVDDAAKTAGIVITLTAE